ANIDARNGIITNHPVGTFNGLNVHDATIKNIWLRGIYNSASGSSFSITDNTISNVQASTSSIAIFDWVGAGVIDGNTISAASDAIATNHSRGVQITNNTITDSSSGIHSDNNGDSGGVGDTTSNNSVSACRTDGYGIFVFVPYVPVTVSNNTVTDCTVTY